MRGALGLRVPWTPPAAPVAPAISRCGSTASWPDYSGAVQYDLQWSVGATSNSPGAPVTLEDVVSGVSVPFAAQTEAGNEWFFARLRALLAGNVATAWSPWALAGRINDPSPATAVLTAGVGLSVQAPFNPSDSLFVVTSYDVEVQYAYGTGAGPTGSWAAFHEWYEVPITNGVTYQQPPSGVWYRARVRYRGTRCGNPWVGDWGAWSNAAYGGPSGPEGGGEVGGN